ncbi:related to Nuclear import protein MOG1 [Saccharomycodes ludwigii]|uniref:Related to Nuclear import protein MOG1 n=1 Tax=Saccharomycodes ludwigii TaxID=36035 RepID=A0A376BAL3_9ASCO|nr:hypothetical protein SCDLUD_002228 [Saccharomycodes ludwigii]KAH3902406.1 hypothetical protein SCDLUD_002228 [Saccharomycodes ludwigii]SSD61696.1 related to Nuclear import protein MOG1 [Saccharomycodes ludwigii]
MSANLVSTDLYGGAIKIDLPPGFMDVSMLREIPDNQEVYVNSRTEQEIKDNKYCDGLGSQESIIIDLLQRVKADSDFEALKIHLNEISEINQTVGGYEIIKTDEIESNTDDKCKAFSAIIRETSLKWGKKSEAHLLNICVGIIRLSAYDTDVLISINVPELQYTDSAYDILTNKIIKSFQLVDPSLFA